ncbi:DNA repair protein [Wickerhamomyces ciferrii]|uniref:DNA repair protein n=1 Tax=Wickerhamomyces ciferrii (strain ATCC 14091 / BCRC 22168 / CBS 111 / JCM 3599 / NBRC 0793 / NRRL Y-1031 F-60-10) TaxID=1206466 RepID=K0KCM2_WICCF|nr:DNA repair protein [Wickerhamomyces ciferrii]CCH42820.1 DNA repair protein [Wickerhamomyces ciferrii]
MELEITTKSAPVDTRNEQEKSMVTEEERNTFTRRIASFSIRSINRSIKSRVNSLRRRNREEEEAPGDVNQPFYDGLFNDHEPVEGAPPPEPPVAAAEAAEAAEAPVVPAVPVEAAEAEAPVEEPEPIENNNQIKKGVASKEENYSISLYWDKIDFINKEMNRKRNKYLMLEKKTKRAEKTAGKVINSIDLPKTMDKTIIGSILKDLILRDGDLDVK